MPTLNWIGKDKVVGHHNDVPYHVLEHQYGYSAEKGQTTEPTHSGNMIIHGDNLLALKSLMPMYEGRIKCIYIPQFGIRIVHKKVGSLTNILYLYR